ncbi:energy-coupling factor transport system ATP-binding protein [Entomoplasma freundtii]|uniref:Cobalt ABC transporter ATP-binding subunit n=1 Tax=Entomoplasma freundtii TaxID=74700 RepID=A0A2K8NS33_9MOLU|nr:energy-coupling factor transporter ATPase [Entomoplasma freundtii]ATZ16587.1 cobalt ABC transporter ATP-binding subunit [Entomoplasma freundtii]TDY58247.1 energy-coupling factor transport system ATP-binding protein [Entomoplasma freundtii]
MELDEFLVNRLTNKDLEEYEKILNKVYHYKMSASNDFFEAKRQFLEDKISKEQFLKAKEAEKKAKKEFLEVLHNKAFKVNYKQAKRNLERHRVGHKDHELYLHEYRQAKKIYYKFKRIVSERGRNAKVAKLSDVAIAVNDLSFRYSPSTPIVLKHVSFQIKEGEYVAVIGHNGSGKSTLSKLLIGVLNHNQGTIEMFGNLVTSHNIDQVRQFLGIVFQNPDNQFIGSTVRADIAFGLENKCVNPKKMGKIIKNAAELVGMEKFLDSEPLNLSGGQKQRVAIASAIALDPSILIFDEATSMLDPKGKREIKEIMVNLRDQGDKTILSVTHDMDEILNADKVLVMNQGEAIRFGTPHEIIGDIGFLESIHLGMPFVYQVQEAFKKAGLPLKKASTMDELVAELWQKK